jgi:hypothetical protein
MCDAFHICTSHVRYVSYNNNFATRFASLENSEQPIQELRLNLILKMVPGVIY